MIMIKLTRMGESGIYIKPLEEEYRLFSSVEKAETWLQANGFSKRPRTFFKGDPICWCHDNEAVWQYIDVEFQEIEADCDAPFKGLEKTMSPWARAARIDGYIEGLEKAGLSKEEIDVAVKKRFG